MRLFRRLRLLQRHLLARPVSAAILQVAVEEEAIQGVADVVVMRDVRARPAAAVERIDPRDRKSVVEGKSVSVRVDLGGRRTINKKTKKIKNHSRQTNNNKIQK